MEPLITSATWNLWLLQLCRTYYFSWSPQLCETFVASVGRFCYGMLVVSATKFWSPRLRGTFVALVDCCLRYVASKSSTVSNETPFLAPPEYWDLWWETLEEAEPTQRKTELEAGALVENISGLSRKTITCTLCPPRSHSSGTICPHIPRVSKTFRPPTG